ncbi:hypothetical protein [Thorsellia kenyensis]|uniref:CHAP domain-containing protein n=1 Tax=Thorsellia kenyensis TaxID=1549888 RepID=A0ABV6CD91_9GAMM
MDLIKHVSIGVLCLVQTTAFAFNDSLTSSKTTQSSMNFGLSPSQNDKNLLLTKSDKISKNSKFSTVIYNKNWDLQGSINYLKANAQPKSTGECAKAVRLALAQGGIHIEAVPSAKYLGESLMNKGFKEIPKDSQLIAGDIAVIQPPKGDIHGHSAMFDGKIWISDFKQQTFYPGNDYLISKPQYKIYRLN